MLPERLHQWVDRGWLRGTDAALAGLLAEQGGEGNETVLLLAAIVSRQVADGYIRLDIASPPSIEAMPEEEAETPLHWLANLDFAQAHQALCHSCVVHVADSDLTNISNQPLVWNGQSLYLNRYWTNEQLIHHALEHRLKAPHAELPELKHRLDALFPVKDDTPDWQRIACAIASRSRFTLITGGPGTGKTHTVLRILGLLQAVRHDTEPAQPLRIRLAAPTGKAAARLSESISAELDALPLPASIRNTIPHEVTTLHRLLGPRPGSRLFRHHRDNPLHADVVVVDEASMIDQELTARLLDALRPDTMLILLGDKDQLAAVEAGAVLGELCQGIDAAHYTNETSTWLAEASGDDVSAWENPASTPLQQHIVKLRKSHRFSQDGGIGALAEAIRLGQTSRIDTLLNDEDQSTGRINLRHPMDTRIETAALDGYRPYLDTLQKHRPADSDYARQAAWARKVIEAFRQYQLLAVVRHGPLGVTGLNERIAQRLKTENLISKDWGWYEGRPVMVTRNDYELDLMNGDVGICLNIQLPNEAMPRLRVAFELPDKQVRFFLPSRLEAVESVFAMTVHKSQGSEFGHVLLVLPETLPPQNRRELLYTAVTRARGSSWIAKMSSPPLQ